MSKGIKFLFFRYICYPESKKYKTMKIVADSAIPFLRGVLEPFAEVRYLPGADISAADVPRRRRPRDPHPHAMRRRPAGRFARADDRHGDHRIRPHRHGVVRGARHRGLDGRRLQRPGRAAMGGGPCSPTSPAGRGGSPRSGRWASSAWGTSDRSCSVTPKRGDSASSAATRPARSGSAAGSCRSGRWPARPTS